MQKNCQNCALDHWCENKEWNALCVRDLKPGMHIRFKDSNSGEIIKATVAHISATENLEFADCDNRDMSGIAGVYVTEIEIL